MITNRHSRSMECGAQHEPVFTGPDLGRQGAPDIETHPGHGLVVTYQYTGSFVGGSGNVEDVGFAVVAVAGDLEVQLGPGLGVAAGAVVVPGVHQEEVPRRIAEGVERVAWAAVGQPRLVGGLDAVDERGGRRGALEAVDGVEGFGGQVGGGVPVEGKDVVDVGIHPQDWRTSVIDQPGDVGLRVVAFDACG
ncbi:MAG: hypothetical protein ACRELV_04025 [Longimicrobiales bacterium]